MEEEKQQNDNVIPDENLGEGAAVAQDGAVPPETTETDAAAA